LQADPRAGGKPISIINEFSRENQAHLKDIGKTCAYLPLRKWECLQRRPIRDAVRRLIAEQGRVPMAILKITNSGDTDFRGGPAETNIDQIVFETPGPGRATGIFAPAQFGAGLISNAVVLTGDAFENRIRVDFAAPATFSAAGWSFLNWGANDEVQLFGSIGSDTITGSARRDNIATSNGLTNGIDVIAAGAGNDRIQMTGNSFAAGTKVDGGTQEAGGFDEVTSNGVNDDLRAVAFSNVERLTLTNSDSTTILNGNQIGTGAFTQLAAEANEATTLRVLGSDVDLRGVTTFVEWDADNAISIEGTSISSNVLFGSSQDDSIQGTGNSSDLITGGGGKDTLLGGKGADNFRYFAGSEAVAGEVVAGGLGKDAFSLFNTGAIDLGALNAVDIETLDFVSGNSAATLRANQFGGSEILAVSGSAGVDQVIVNAVGQSADLSKVAFNTFTNGTDSITINGSDLQDTLVGSNQNDTIDGKGGNDAMTGGGGDDVFRVGEAGDIVNEAAGQGLADKVIVTTSYVLTKGAEVELLTTNSSSATVAIDLTGNELVQEIFGNAGVNTLNDGGVGAADTLRGFGGNDTYRVFNSGDVIIESSSQGVTDRVTAAVDYTLGKGIFIELFTTNGSTGTSNIDLTGNEIAQEILGNAGDNRLEGKGGADSLRGFGGADSFTFATALGAGNIDTIVDFNVADDRFLLSDAIFTELDVGTLSAAAFRANTTGLAQDTSDRIIYETDTGKLFYDEDGTGAIAGIQFATISVNLALTNADFSVA
jgi:Ca2+-binding RTX toxin-like protein